MRSAGRSSRIASGSHAVLDIGASKVACFIAQISNTGEIHVTGVGHQLSRGIRGSVITDFTEAETSIIAAVHAAEQMAGVTIENVMVCLAGGGIASRSVTLEMELAGEEVTERDLLDILEQGRQPMEEGGGEIIHLVPLSYGLDETRGIVDPRRMCGARLSADLHIITAYANVTRNLAHCVARCHLNVEEFVVASHAAGFACLDADEMQLGVTVIDMGGSTTGVSIFSGGKNVYSDVIPLGGMHLTSDLARGLSTTLSHAERLKTLHGSCLSTPSDDQVMVSAPLLGEDADNEEGNVISRAALVSILRPRIEEIFELVRQRIESAGLDPRVHRRVVLTGGASQLIGARELASRVFSRQVRLARPKALPGLAEAVSGPAFSAALGMLHYVVKKPLEERLLDHTHRNAGLSAKLRKAMGWVKESF